MTIRYRITYGDLLAFSFYHHLHSPLIIGFNLLCLAVLGVEFLGAIPHELPPAAKVLVWLVLEGLFCAALIALTAVVTILGVVSRRNKTILAESTLTIGPDMFVSESVYQRTEQKWAAVQKLARTRRHIYIYVSQGSAHVIPRRAFQDYAQWCFFYDYCQQRTQTT